MTWVSFPEILTEKTPSLASEIQNTVNARISSGAFTTQDVLNIQNRALSLIPDHLALSNERLEKLRRLCQLWEVDIRTTQISSHRKFIGPVIVRAKKLLFPLIRFVMKDFIREQKDFNAATISLLADLCNESKAPKV